MEAATCDPPMIEQNMDGTQTLIFGGQALDLPAESVWTLEQDPTSGEYHVTSPNRSPKTVLGLMRLKRVRKQLVPLVKESMFGRWCLEPRKCSKLQKLGAFHMSLQA